MNRNVNVYLSRLVDVMNEYQIVSVAALPLGLEIRLLFCLSGMRIWCKSSRASGINLVQGL